MEAKEQSSINNAYKLLCARRMRRDTVMEKVGQREVICREYLESHCIYLQCLKKQFIYKIWLMYQIYIMQYIHYVVYIKI